jgi:hypothetical protein
MAATLPQQSASWAVPGKHNSHHYCDFLCLKLRLLVPTSTRPKPSLWTHDLTCDAVLCCAAPVLCARSGWSAWPQGCSWTLLANPIKTTILPSLPGCRIPLTDRLAALYRVWEKRWGGCCMLTDVYMQAHTRTCAHTHTHTHTHTQVHRWINHGRSCRVYG